MKVLQVAVLIVGAASSVLASADGVRRGEYHVENLSTSIVYQTSLYTVTRCGTDSCTESGTTIVTSIVALTTTVCPESSAAYLTASSSLLPTIDPSSQAVSEPTVLPTFSLSVSINPTISVPGVLPPTSKVTPSVPLPSASATTSNEATATTLVTPSISLASSYVQLTTITLSSGTIPPILWSSPATESTATLSSDAYTSTDSLPTSFVVDSSATYATPWEPTAHLSISPSLAGTLSLHTPPAFTSIIPTPPLHTTWFNTTTVVDGTTRVTSVLSQTFTSVITVPHKSNISTVDDSIPTASRNSSISGVPSGSGFPSTASGNQTVISPKPTYTNLPNMGRRISTAGKSSIAAIIVALAFAHFA